MRHITTPLAGCMLVGAVYFTREYFPFWSDIARFEQGVLFLAGLVAGIRLPDIDLAIPGLPHRSGITHSCGFALLALLLGHSAIAGGLALGIALHLSSDLQPKAWTGGALIKLPLLGSIGMASPGWILVNIVGCFGVLFAALDREHNADQLIISGVMLAGGAWYFYQEEKKRLLPLVTLAFSILLVHQIRTGKIISLIPVNCLLAG